MMIFAGLWGIENTKLFGDAVRILYPAPLIVRIGIGLFFFLCDR